MQPCFAALVALLAARAVSADVLDAADAGFTIQREIVVAAERAGVWEAAIGEVDDWWNPEHTVAGGTMSIEATPLGCFCERLDGKGAVAHLQVTSVSTGVMLRLSGGLGPLGLMGVSGNMTWEFFDSDLGTRVRLTYAVGGYRDGGLKDLAQPVDDVLGDALRRLQQHAEVRDAG